MEVGGREPLAGQRHHTVEAQPLAATGQLLSRLEHRSGLFAGRTETFAYSAASCSKRESGPR